MKKAILSLSLIVAFITFGNVLPKKAVGEYYAEVPDYEFKNDSKKMRATGYSAALILREQSVTYHCGKLHFDGIYKSIVANGNVVDVDLELGTDVQFAFDMNVLIDTKTGAVTIKGMESVPETMLMRSDVIEKQHKKGFKRL